MTENITARQNIERQARELGNIDLFVCYVEMPDRIYAIPDPRLEPFCLLNAWLHDCLDQHAAQKLHGVGASTYREPYGLHPTMQITFLPRASWPFTKTLPEGVTRYADIDLDESAPGVDVVSTVWHGAEVLENKLGRKLTDEERIAHLQDLRFGTPSSRNNTHV